MDYVDWCSQVLTKIIELVDQSTDARAIGVSDQQLGHALFGNIAYEAAFWNSREREGLHDALRDMEAMGLATGRHSQFWKPADLARSYLANPVSFWELVCAAPLETKQRELLEITNRLSAEVASDYARVADVEGNAIISQLAWASDIGLVKVVIQELIDRGYIEGQYFMGTGPESIKSVNATLKGLIWDIRREFTQESLEIDRLVAEWETTSVDFKRDVHLDTKDEEAEFVKDILGLINTKSSGLRRLIIGFHPKSHEYSGAPNVKLTQDWIERVLINDTEPLTEVHYRTLAYRHGPVGVIEVIRDSTKLPYKVRRSIGDKKRIRQGQIFVRHGSQTEEPTAAELAAIEKEGKQARGESTDDDNVS